MEVPEEFVGPVVDLLGSRKGQMVDMNTSDQGLTRVTYVMPTRSAFHHTPLLCRSVPLKRNTALQRGVINVFLGKFPALDV